MCFQEDSYVAKKHSKRLVIMGKKYKTRFVIEVVVEGAPLEWDSLYDITNMAERDGLYMVVDEVCTRISGNELTEWLRLHDKNN